MASRCIMLLGATSVLCVPLSDGERSYGALTLARRAGEGRLEVWLTWAWSRNSASSWRSRSRLDRMFRRHSEIIEALQASLLPRDLPPVPGVEIAAAYIAATEGIDVGGDFYDVYSCPAAGAWRSATSGQGRGGRDGHRDGAACDAGGRALEH